MFIMPAAPNQLSDPLLDCCGMVALHFSVLCVCKYTGVDACVHFGSNFCGALLQCVNVPNRFKRSFRSVEYV